MPTKISRQSRGRLGQPPKQPQATSITSFTRVSKVQSISEEVAQKVSRLEVAGARIEVVLSSRKRKAEDDDEPQSTAQASSRSPHTAISTKKARREILVDQTVLQLPAFFSKCKKYSLDDKENTATVEATSCVEQSIQVQQVVTQKNLKRRRSSDADTASEADAGVLLERLNLSSPSRKRTRVVASASRVAWADKLPQELLDLLSLHTAFLKALTLHYAHHGSNAPADVHTLCPSIAQNWGKRKVNLEDIRRCIGVLCMESEIGTTSNPLTLVDYGRGKTCIELEKNTPGIPQEEKLNATFKANLNLLWSARRTLNAAFFITSLPMAPVNMCASAAKAAPLLTKGQRALQDLMDGVAKKQQEKETAKVTPSLFRNADGSAMSLLDRIRHKEQQAQAAGLAAPSPAELQRRAALHRADDVAGVVGMLATSTAEGRARISFTMAALLARLRDSLRIPIAPEEGACCVRLIANEIAPQWLRVVTIGGRENVVVQTMLQPSKAVILEKVSELLA